MTDRVVFILLLGLLGVLSIFCVIVVPSSASAAESSTVYVDEYVDVPFVPEKVLVLQEIAPGRIEKYEGVVIPPKLKDGEEPPTDGKSLVGARIWWDSQRWKDATKPIVFFFHDSSNRFAAIPVRTWSTEEVLNNTKDPIEVKKEIGAVQTEILDTKYELDLVDFKLKSLRMMAASITEVGQIVDINIELKDLSGIEQELTTERVRLQKLVEIGHSSPDPDDIVSLRKGLSADLKETAKATALADRLSRRYNEAAVHRIKQKIKLIDVAEKVDIKQLAQQVLRVRKKRREYENRMGLHLTDYKDQF